jgi:peroxiredoxin
MFSAKKFFAVLPIALLTACGVAGDNLLPSGSDMHQTAVAGTIGSGTNQNTPALTLPDLNGGTFSLAAETAAGKTVVIYFTMWCPICDEHQQDIQSAVMPNKPSVEYVLIDYVSGSVAASSAARDGAGWSVSPFRTLVDNGSALSAFHATMATTVVVDKNGVVRMNELYKTSSFLLNVLGSVP